MLMFVIQHQPHRAGTDLRRELVACLLAHGSTFSRVGASGKPGAVHSVQALCYGMDCRTAPLNHTNNVYRLFPSSHVPTSSTSLCSRIRRKRKTLHHMPSRLTLPCLPPISGTAPH